MNDFEIIGRTSNLFADDLVKFSGALDEAVSGSSFLVIGGAGSIGQAVTKEIFKRDPSVLHVVDISENNLVELVRDLRSTVGYTSGEFATFAIDCGSEIFGSFYRNSGPYDYVLNLSALKHVRSESDPYTLMRLLEVNIVNTLNVLDLASVFEAKKYFCVSTDKAANPVNMMGASKRLMEQAIFGAQSRVKVSSARFANVAFSDGSLLHGFNQRFLNKQPISAPSDVRRYFVSKDESGLICLFSTIFGNSLDIFFPKLIDPSTATTFSDIACKYVQAKGYEPFMCSSEQEARSRCRELISRGQWPCYFFNSDTAGEKSLEEFYMADEVLDLDSFKAVGIVKFKNRSGPLDTGRFMEDLQQIKLQHKWSRSELIDLVTRYLPEFTHLDADKFLDGRM